MNCDSQEQATIFKFLQRNSIQIAIGLTVLAAACYGMLLWTPNQGDEWLARRINSLGGTVSFEAEQINDIGIFNQNVPSDVLAAISRTSTLKELWLIHTDFTDDELKQLKGLTGLKSLYLGDARVTDKGLEHLKNMTILR